MTFGEAITSGAQDEPLWRIVTYWSVVALFFTVPLLAMLIHWMALAFHWIEPLPPQGTFYYLWTFHKVLAALLAAMLGFNSWDKRINGGGRKAR